MKVVEVGVGVLDVVDCECVLGGEVVKDCVDRSGDVFVLELVVVFKVLCEVCSGSEVVFSLVLKLVVEGKVGVKGGEKLLVKVEEMCGEEV